MSCPMRISQDFGLLAPMLENERDWTVAVVAKRKSIWTLTCNEFISFLVETLSINSLQVKFQIVFQYSHVFLPKSFKEIPEEIFQELSISITLYSKFISFFTGERRIFLEGEELTFSEVTKSTMKQTMNVYQARTAWGFQGGRRRPQATRPAGGPPLKWL
jgi:hypothetical protein